MDRVKKGVRQTLLMTMIFAAVISVLLWTFAPSVVALFGLSDTAAEYCIAHLKTVAFLNLLLNAHVPLFGLFQGSNHVAIPTIIATTVLAVRVTSTYLLRFTEYWGHTIIWKNGFFGYSVGVILAYAFFLSGRWQKNSLIKTTQKQ